MIDIIQALEQQKTDCYEPQARVICDDGLLSVSDAVFETYMRALGFDKEEREEWMKEPVNLRHKFIKQWDGNENKY